MRTVTRQYTLTRFLGQCSLSLGHNHNKEFHFTNNIGKSTIPKIDQSANVSISLRLCAAMHGNVLCSICTRGRSQCHPANGVGICVNPLRQFPMQLQKILGPMAELIHQSAALDNEVNTLRSGNLNPLPAFPMTSRSCLVRGNGSVIMFPIIQFHGIIRQ